MVELKIDKEKLLEACEKCSQVKQFTQSMWPEIFKEETKFKVGDIVEVITEARRIKSLEGKIGVIVSTTSLERLGVEFQENVMGHDCAGEAKEGHGWYVWLENLKLLYRKPQIKGE